MKTKINGIQISGKITQQLDSNNKNILYLKDFESLTIDTNKGNWYFDKENLIKFVEQLNKVA